MTSVGVRELKAHLSAYLKKVKAGEDVFITDRGRVVARLTPDSSAIPVRDTRTTEEKMHATVAAGLASWSGRPPRIPDKRVPLLGARQVSDILLDERGER